MTCHPQNDPQVNLEWWIEGRRGDEQEAFYSGADHQKCQKPKCRYLLHIHLLSAQLSLAADMAVVTAPWLLIMIK
jgi:hypothetical protein